MPFDRTEEKYDLLPVPMEIFPQVKEVAGFQNQVALYRISFPNGKQVWRITTGSPLQRNPNFSLP